MDRKGLTPIISVVLLFLLVISLFSAAYTFFLSMSTRVQEKSFKEFSSISTQCVKIIGINKNNILVYNCGGDGVINNNTIKVFLNDKEVSFYVPKELKSQERGEVVIDSLPDECSDKMILSILTASGTKQDFDISSTTDFDGDGKKEICYKGKLAELDVDSLRSSYLYNGYPLMFYNSWWPLYFSFSVVYKEYRTGEILGVIDNPLKKGNADYKIIKCRDGSSGCVPQPYGNTGNCNDGIVKDYGDLENPTGEKIYRDNDYRDCYTSNPWLIRSREFWQWGSGKIGNFFRIFQGAGEGKYRLCVKYKMQTPSIETNETCMDFVASRLNVGINKISQSHKNFGDTISFSSKDVYLKYDNSVPTHLDGRRCRVYLWDYFHNPNADSGVSLTFRRHSSWDHYDYFGFFLSSRAADKPETYVNISFDLSNPNCRIDSIYDNMCGWIWGVWNNYKTHVFTCKKEYASRGKWYKEDCKMTKKCDRFEHIGLYGEIFNMTLYVNNEDTTWRDIRVYVRCADRSVFGDNSKKYVVKVSGVDKFWVNDMDYTAEKEFSEALTPHTDEYNLNGDGITNFNCDIPLTFCGKARYFLVMWDWPLFHGSGWSGGWGTTNNGEYVCVGGPQCPHANC